MAAGIALVVILGIAAYLCSLYNGLVSLRRQTANAFSQIEVQLSRRYDLIPNLVEVVKAGLRHERETFEQVIIARNKAVMAQTVVERAEAETDVKRTLQDVYAYVESYPELKSNESILSLQSALRNTEDKIAFARQYYNDVVTAYNTRLETFPTSVYLHLGYFEPKELFLIEDPKQRENVQVHF